MHAKVREEKQKWIIITFLLLCTTPITIVSECGPVYKNNGVLEQDHGLSQLNHWCNAFPHMIPCTPFVQHIANGIYLVVSKWGEIVFHLLY